LQNVNREKWIDDKDQQSLNKEARDMQDKYLQNLNKEEWREKREADKLRTKYGRERNRKTNRTKNKKREKEKIGKT
jgi:hypothetical protein